MADLRRCIGSAKFGIEAHEAPPEAFPTQPSQRDGLGRMCKPHWNQYTTALRKAALARKAAEGGAVLVEIGTAAPKAPRRKKGQPEPIKTRLARKSREAKAPMAHIDQDEPPKARSGSALRRARRPTDAVHPSGSIADFTALPEAEVAKEPAAK